MDTDDLVAWLEGVATVASREGDRWRRLRLSGDLSVNGWTPDRVHLHAVGDVLAQIQRLASAARSSALAMVPAQSDHECPTGRAAGYCPFKGCPNGVEGNSLALHLDGVLRIYRRKSWACSVRRRVWYAWVEDGMPTPERHDERTLFYGEHLP